MKKTKHILKAKLKDGSGWLYWDQFGYLTTETGKKKPYEDKRIYGVLYNHYVAQIFHRIDTDSVCLCSGIKDFNGKFIFRNDILSFGNERGVVTYKEGCFCVRLYSPDWKNRSEPAIDIVMNEWDDVTVIGNAYDNPDLIGGGMA